MNDQTKKQIQPKQTEQGGIEGEGSYTATHNYNDGLRESVKKGNAEKLGRDAQKALEGAEGEALKLAENAGKSGKSSQK